MEPQQSSETKIFRTVIIVVIIDLAIAFLITLIGLGTTGFKNMLGTANLSSIPIGLGLVLIIIDLAQSLLLIPAALVLLVRGNWEIAAGLMLAISAIAFLSFILCTFGLPFAS